MNGAVSQDQQDVVHVAALSRHRVLAERLDHGGEHRRPGQADMRQHLLVSLQDAVRREDSRLLRVAVQGEAMTDSGLAVRHGSEAKRWEHLIVVVGLQDGSDLANGSRVLVLGAHEV